MTALTSRTTPPLVALVALVALSVALTGCRLKGQVGDPCEVDGDGFTRKDPCSTMCLDWEITCPSGEVVTPGVCAGEVCGVDGVCPDDQACLVVDSFVDNARCVPVEVCDPDAADASEGDGGDAQPAGGPTIR